VQRFRRASPRDVSLPFAFDHFADQGFRTTQLQRQLKRAHPAFCESAPQFLSVKIMRPAGYTSHGMSIIMVVTLFKVKTLFDDKEKCVRLRPIPKEGTK
jgi:hypothetical protein